MRWIMLAMATGASGCAGIETVGDRPLAERLACPVAALSDALDAHPETPDAVGQAATTVVIVAQAGSSDASQGIERKGPAKPCPPT